VREELPEADLLDVVELLHVDDELIALFGSHR
jgi:hypothetical protein